MQRVNGVKQGPLAIITTPLTIWDRRTWWLFAPYILSGLTPIIKMRNAVNPVWALFFQGPLSSSMGSHYAPNWGCNYAEA